MPLRILFADRKLGAASKLAFLQLWTLAGQQPGRVTLSADWLGSACGRSPKAAWLWLRELEAADLVKIVERNERRGTMSIDIYNPCPGAREAIPDAQLPLPLDRSCSEVSEPKPPSPLVPKNPEDLLTCQSTKDQSASKNSTNSMSAARDVAAAVAAIVGTDAPPEHVQKAALKARILAAARPGEIAEWVAGATANLVIYHDVPYQDVAAILRDLQAMTEAGTLRNAGAFFHAKARDLAARHGKPWPRHAP